MTGHSDWLMSGRQNYSIDPTPSFPVVTPLFLRKPMERKTPMNRWGGPRMAPRHPPSTKPWELPLPTDNAAVRAALLEGLGPPDSPFRELWGTGQSPSLSRVTQKQYNTGVNTWPLKPASPSFGSCSSSSKFCDPGQATGQLCASISSSVEWVWYQYLPTLLGCCENKGLDKREREIQWHLRSAKLGAPGGLSQ